MMKATSVWNLAAALAVLGANLFASGDEKSKDALTGSWKAIAAERSGKPAPDLKGHELTFTGNRFTIRSKEGKPLYEGTFQIDASKNPATIDFVHTKGDADGKTWQGIYELVGDTLKICDNAGDVTKPRPTALATKEGSGLDMLTFEKEKK
jgi:uncharacterized protein (TIGR03067 family)